MRTLLILFCLITTPILISAQNLQNSNNRDNSAAIEGFYDVVFSQDFEHLNSPIEYLTNQWNQDWNNPGWRDGDNRTEGWWADHIKDSIVIDDETESTVLKFNFKDTLINDLNGFSPWRGGDFWVTELGQEATEIYFSYNVKFRPGFEWNLGGKLPGTRGGTEFSMETKMNGLPPSEEEGYNCFVMFKSEGRLQWYLYHHNQEKEQWGDNITWDDYQPEGLNYTSNGAVSLDVSEERWYNITIRVAVNTFTNGQPNHDGLMEGFVDGKLVSSIDGLYLLPAFDVNKGVNKITMGHFFGGNDNRFGPLRDEWTLFDDFICFTYDESLNVPRGNTPSQPGRVLQLPNLKTQEPEPADLLPPTVPSGLRASKITGTTVDLVWNPSQDNKAVDGYRVFLNGHRTGITDKTSFRIEGLEPQTTYSISVSAFDKSSNESDRSEAFFATTHKLDTVPPPVPTGVHVTNTTENSLSIAWEKMADSIDFEFFHIYISGEEIGSIDVNSFELRDLQPDTEYIITLTAFDASMNESPHSDPISARTDPHDSQAPSVPTGLIPTVVGKNSIETSWNTSVDNVGVTGYRIFMNGLAVATSSTNSHTITGLAPGTNYSLSVTAYDHALNESANSKEIFVTTENPDNSSTPLLPEVKIVNFVNTGTGYMAAAVAEIESMGHSELLDFGLRVTKKNAGLNENSGTVFYADKKNSELTHNNRVKDGIQIMYDFTEGEGSVIYDKSESNKSVNLNINNPLVTSWLPGQGLKVDNSTLITSQEAPLGMLNSISSSNEITLESWIRTGASDQSGPARILSISQDSQNRVATLGQSGDDDSFNYIARLTTTSTSQNGTPEVACMEDYYGLNLHHVVYTRNSEGIEKLHINGKVKYSGMREGDISVIGDNNYLVLANELSGGRPWIGNYYLVAVYDKALNEDDISRNFEAGTGVVRYSTNMPIEPNESYIVTPFARTVQGIAYGTPVELDANDLLNNFQEDSISMTIYPNPSTGDFRLRVKCNVDHAQSAYVRIADMKGNLVYVRQLSLSEITEESQYDSSVSSGMSVAGIDLEFTLSSQLEEGIYLVALVVGDKSVGERLVIQH